MGFLERIGWKEAIINHESGYVLYLEDGALTAQEIPVGSRDHRTILVRFLPKNEKGEYLEERSDYFRLESLPHELLYVLKCIPTTITPLGMTG